MQKCVAAAEIKGIDHHYQVYYAQVHSTSFILEASKALRKIAKSRRLEDKYLLLLVLDKLVVVPPPRHYKDSLHSHGLILKSAAH